MNGIEWLNKMLNNEQARENIPLELQATLPLPKKNEHGKVKCWYYRIENQPDGIQIFSPERYVIWDITTMQILSAEVMRPQPLGSGIDILTKAHRELEDKYLSGTFTEFLNGAKMDYECVVDEWIACAPQALRQWLSESLKEEK